jgi:two-component system, OmpR family, response regulator VanR
MRVLVVEDEPYLAEAIRDGLRLEAIAADLAGDGDTALELLSVNAYDIAVLDRDIPGPSGDEIAERIVASGSGMPILMLTAAARLDDEATGFELGADDYLTKPFELQELVLRLRALDRRRAHNRPPVREIADLRLDPFRREVYRGAALEFQAIDDGVFGGVAQRVVGVVGGVRIDQHIRQFLQPQQPCALDGPVPAVGVEHSFLSFEDVQRRTAQPAAFQCRNKGLGIKK